MSTKTTLEEAYFHISNSGFTYAIVEEVHKREKCTVFPEDWVEGLRSGKYKPQGSDNPTKLPEETRYNRQWSFHVRLGVFDTRVSFKFPLVPLKVRWMIEALQRVLVRMETPTGEPTDGVEFAFQTLNTATLYARDGQAVEEKWTGSGEPSISS